MHTWHLLHGQDGYTVEVAEVPWWAVAVSSAVEFADAATGHVLCGQCMPDWVWRLPLGKAKFSKYEVDREFPENSLGSLLYRCFNWTFAMPYRNERQLHRFEVSEEVAVALGAEPGEAVE